MSVHYVSPFQGGLSSAAAAAGEKVSGLGNTIHKIFSVVASIFHSIRDSLRGVDERNRGICSLLKEPSKTDFDILAELKKERANDAAVKEEAAKSGRSVSSPPCKKSWMLQQFFIDMVDRNFHLTKVISKEGKVLFNGQRQGADALTKTFEDLFNKDQEKSGLVQVLCLQNLQASFVSAIMKKCECIFTTNQQKITINQESEDRIQVSWLYELNQVVDGVDGLKRMPFGTCEYVSTLHKSGGKWTVSQEIRNPLPIRSSWTIATIATVAVGVAAIAIAAFSGFRPNLSW